MVEWCFCYSAWGRCAICWLSRLPWSACARRLALWGALVPVGMAVAAVVAGMVRKLLFVCGGVNARSLGGIFLLGTFWHLPLTLLVAHAAAGHESGAWMLPLYFTAAGAVASVVLVLVLRKALPRG